MRAVLAVLWISALFDTSTSQTPSKYCNPTISTPLKVTSDNVTCTLNPNFPYNKSCKTWQIMAAIAFVNTPYPFTELQKIRTYLDTAGFNCSQASHFLTLTPQTADCFHHSSPWTFQDSVLQQLIDDPTETVTNTSNIDDAIGDIMNHTLQCAKLIKMDGIEMAGIVYLFTDYNCSQLIDNQVAVLMNNIKQLLNLGFSVQLVMFSSITDECQRALECLNCSSSQCQMVSIDHHIYENCRFSSTESKYCSNPSITITGSGIQCTLDPLQYNQYCSTWNIIAGMVFFHSDVRNQLVRVNGYLNQTCSACTSSSLLQVVTPQWTNCNSSYTGWWGPDSTTLMNKLINNSNSALATPETKDTAVAAVMDHVTDCAGNTMISQPHTGVVYLFTDFICNELPQDQVVSLMENVKKLIKEGFSVSIVLLNETNIDDCSDILDCLNCKQHKCQISLIDDTNSRPATCRVESQASTTSVTDQNMVTQYKQTPTTTNPPTSSSTLIPNSAPSSTGLNALELALIIGIPCLSLFIFCGVFCTKCSKIRQRAMEKVGWKRKTLHPGAFNGVMSSSNNVDNFAMANKYIDIQELAARNKRSENELLSCWEVSPNHLVIHDNEVLGTGAFSNVFKGTLTGDIPLLKAQAGISMTIETKRDGTCETAVKRLPAHADEQSRIDFFHEIDFMKRLGYHVHTIAMLGCVSDPWDPLILIEYCHHGDMLNFLRKRRSYLLIDKEVDCPADADMCIRMKDLISFSWQISDGLSYLSSKKFIHRDVAARNVLLTKNLVAKWMAIESLKFYEYSVKSDVWAFGVCLFEIFSMGDGPYQAIQPLEMLKHLENGNRLELPDNCPHEVYELMMRCWDANADLRPTFEEIRHELTSMLNLEGEHYGYLAIDPKNIPQNLKQHDISPKDKIEKLALSLSSNSDITDTPPPPISVKQKSGSVHEIRESGESCKEKTKRRSTSYGGGAVVIEQY